MGLFPATYRRGGRKRSQLMNNFAKRKREEKKKGERGMSPKILPYKRERKGGGKCGPCLFPKNKKKGRGHTGKQTRWHDFFPPKKKEEEKIKKSEELQGSHRCSGFSFRVCEEGKKEKKVWGGKEMAEVQKILHQDVQPKRRKEKGSRASAPIRVLAFQRGKEERTNRSRVTRAQSTSYCHLLVGGEKKKKWEGWWGGKKNTLDLTQTCLLP